MAGAKVSCVVPSIMQHDARTEMVERDGRPAISAHQPRCPWAPVPAARRCHGGNRGVQGQTRGTNQGLDSNTQHLPRRLPHQIVEHDSLVDQAWSTCAILNGLHENVDSCVSSISPAGLCRS
jgi:hypothetical protein